MRRHSKDQVINVHYVEGYSSLAGFIASDSDKSTAIYRRFHRLSARNLLYYQSELAELEAEQDALDAEDACPTRSTVAKESARNWQILTERANEQGNIRERRRLDVAEQIRRILKEYST